MATVALVAANAGLSPVAYSLWARDQIHYMLGQSGRSFVIGFGHDPPVRPHHASSSCPPAPSPCSWSYYYSSGPNPITLYGALVGGPAGDDSFYDNRDDYYQNEVTCDYNSGFQSAVAGLIQLDLQQKQLERLAEDSHSSRQTPHNSQDTVHEPLARLLTTDQLGAKLPTNDSQKVAKLPTNDSQKVAKLQTNDSQKVAKLQPNDSQKVAKLPTNDSQKVAKLQTNDSQKVSKLPTNDSQKVSKLPTNDSQKVAKLPTNESQKVTKLRRSVDEPKVARLRTTNQQKLAELTTDQQAVSNHTIGKRHTNNSLEVEATRSKLSNTFQRNGNKITHVRNLQEPIPNRNQTVCNCDEQDAVPGTEQAMITTEQTVSKESKENKIPIKSENSSLAKDTLNTTLYNQRMPRLNPEDDKAEQSDMDIRNKTIQLLVSGVRQHDLLGSKQNQSIQYIQKDLKEPRPDQQQNPLATRRDLHETKHYQPVSMQQDLQPSTHDLLVSIQRDEHVSTQQNLQESRQEILESRHCSKESRQQDLSPPRKEGLPKPRIHDVSKPRTSDFRTEDLSISRKENHNIPRNRDVSTPWNHASKPRTPTLMTKDLSTPRKEDLSTPKKLDLRTEAPPTPRNRDPQKSWRRLQDNGPEKTGQHHPLPTPRNRDHSKPTTPNLRTGDIPTPRNQGVYTPSNQDLQKSWRTLQHDGPERTDQHDQFKPRKMNLRTEDRSTPTKPYLSILTPRNPDPQNPGRQQWLKDQHKIKETKKGLLQVLFSNDKRQETSNSTKLPLKISVILDKWMKDQHKTKQTSQWMKDQDKTNQTSQWIKDQHKTKQTSQWKERHKIKQVKVKGLLNVLFTNHSKEETSNSTQVPLALSVSVFDQHKIKQSKGEGLLQVLVNNRRSQETSNSTQLPLDALEQWRKDTKFVAASSILSHPGRSEQRSGVNSSVMGQPQHQGEEKNNAGVVPASTNRNSTLHTSSNPAFCRDRSFGKCNPVVPHRGTSLQKESDETNNGLDFLLRNTDGTTKSKTMLQHPNNKVSTPSVQNQRELHRYLKTQKFLRQRNDGG